MFIIGVLIILMAMILFYWNIPYSPFKKRFDKGMQERLMQTEVTEGLYREEDIKGLPKVLQKYLGFIGLIGQKRYKAVNVLFHKVDFIYDYQKNIVLDMEYDLWLFTSEPFRGAYCKSSLKGIPFDGIDYCTNEKIGGMKGIVGKAVEIFDKNNTQMYQAMLITWLTEGAAFNPGVLLSEYVSYREIDSMHLEATISYQGIKGTGMFIFDESGAIKEFISDERQVVEVNGTMTRIGWKAVYGTYEEKQGHIVPNNIQVVDLYPDHEVIYFSSNNIDYELY